MYVKCGELCNAQVMFDGMTVRDDSSWNALIAGYTKEGEVYVAEDLFPRMPCRNIVLWTAMISGYTQNGFAEEVLDLFDLMLRDELDVKPNWVTIMSGLPACGHSAGLERGRQIHDFACRNGLDSNPSVQIELISMYAKCGSLADARYCFNRMRQQDHKNLIAWNTMITGFASHGCGMESVLTFEEMIRAGVQPDPITCTGLLSGCSHSCFVGVGLKYFNRMSTAYFLEPRAEHYACVVNLLGRAGR